MLADAKIKSFTKPIRLLFQNERLIIKGFNNLYFYAAFIFQKSQEQEKRVAFPRSFYDQFLQLQFFST